MSGELYWFQSNKGVLTIGPDAEAPWHWELRLDGRVLGARCPDPFQAAQLAYSRELGDDELNSLLDGAHVPGDLAHWFYGDPPDVPIPVAVERLAQ